MKKRFLPLFTFLCAGFVISALAQTKPDDAKNAVKYRRSSLYTIMIDDAGLINGPVIKDAFFNAPIPEKFNDHLLDIRSFDSKAFAITPEERAKDSLARKKTSAMGKMFSDAGKGIASSATGGLVDTTNTKDLPMINKKFLASNDIAKKMVAKWFGRSDKGGFNMGLIGTRGSYDATEMAAGVAKSSARGLASLTDAGEELIGNTFVIITRFNYVSKEEIAKAAKGALNAAGSLLGGYGQLATSVASTAADVLAKGYVVKTTSYLYKLTWNDSVAAVFYQDLWTDDSNFEPAKKEAFDKTNLFSLEFVGSESAWADVQSSIYTKKSNDDLIKIATVRAIDAVIAKLEKSYEVFKTKTPLFSTDPLGAKIGLKEGLEGGDKFEVLEQTLDEKTGRTKYVSVGKIKVEKDQIWDNRFMAGELRSSVAEGADAQPVIEFTRFSGANKNLYPGMLIRQVN